MQRLFATAAKGTEPALRDELLELGFKGVRADRGGVHFEGLRREAYRACLCSRIAVRVLEPLGRFECPHEDALYAGVSALTFADVLSPRHTLAVSCAARSSRLTHTQFVAQKTKDAIVDRLRERFGERPDVNRDDPDVHVFVHLVRDVATVYLDHAGAPLHERGYRTHQGEAPLKETLAAAVLRLSGFHEDGAVQDPMCGSGTLLIEAGWWAARRAPGLLRARFGFERWASYDASERAAMRALREAALARVRKEVPPLLGSDIDRGAVASTRANAARAGVLIELGEHSFENVSPSFERGLLVANPPYGERLARGPDLARQLARLVDRFPNQQVGLLMAAEQALGRTRRKPRFTELFNGKIACMLRSYTPISHDEAR